MADCLLGLNPEFPKDRFYGEDPSLSFAERCDRFSVGDSVKVDCDRDDGDLQNYSSDEEVKKLLILRSS